MPSKQKFYVVWKGRTPGVFASWAECSASVTGFAGAEYKSFESRAAAERAYRGAYEDYKGKPVSSLSPQQLARIGRPTVPSLAVDAACSGSPGPLEYRCVETATGRELFRHGPFAQGTNNVGEFLALVEALQVSQQRGLDVPIYTDSANAISWVKAKQCRTRLARTSRNTELFARIAAAERWLADNPVRNRILKWETEAWGENPADYGRK